MSTFMKKFRDLGSFYLVTLLSSRSLESYTSGQKTCDVCMENAHLLLNCLGLWDFCLYLIGENHHMVPTRCKGSWELRSLAVGTCMGDNSLQCKESWSLLDSQLSFPHLGSSVRAGGYPLPRSSIQHHSWHRCSVQQSCLSLWVFDSLKTLPHRKERERSIRIPGDGQTARREGSASCGWWVLPACCLFF